ncbi:unnamed protein product [Closterium sp. Naga37s-1]|nr:unnamed protein product [Closterium sp. Naga37s-1]
MSIEHGAARLSFTFFGCPAGESRPSCAGIGEERNGSVKLCIRLSWEGEQSGGQQELQSEGQQELQSGGQQQLQSGGQQQLQSGGQQQLPSGGQRELQSGGQQQLQSGGQQEPVWVLDVEMADEACTDELESSPMEGENANPDSPDQAERPRARGRGRRRRATKLQQLQSGGQ